jgi:hypothetical protein
VRFICGIQGMLQVADALLSGQQGARYLHPRKYCCTPSNERHMARKRLGCGLNGTTGDISWTQCCAADIRTAVAIPHCPAQLVLHYLRVSLRFSLQYGQYKQPVLHLLQFFVAC